MKHFDKNAVIKEARRLLKELPDGCKGPEDGFVAGASYMHREMANALRDAAWEIQALEKQIKRLKEGSCG